MKLNRSQIIALIAFVLIAAWFAFNTGLSENDNSQTQTISEAEVKLPTVVTRTVRSQTHAPIIKLFGQTEAAREVTIKAETPGPVVSTPIAEGSVVKRGTVLCRQDVNSRQANVDQGLALLKTRQAEYNAAKELVARGFASETQALTAQAALDAAKATVKTAQIELDNINLRAPFAGIYDKKLAEVGDYLAPGQACGLLIELDPLVVVVQLTESQLSLISAGQTANIKLATGETVTGIIKFVESRANPATRTFRAELTAPNKDFSLKAGVTATVQVAGRETTALLIPSHILSLGEQGSVGAKYLDFDNRVRFAITETIDETPGGVWVTGLPSETKIIVKGQNFVRIGTEVVATDEYSQ